MNSRTRRTMMLVAMAAVAALTACATAPGPKFSGIVEPTKDQADIYLYRTSGIFAAAQSFTVNVDDKKVGDLFNASYLHLRLPPGSYKLAVAPGSIAKVAQLQVTLEAGKTSFYQYDFVSGLHGNIFFLGASIEPRPAQQAMRELGELSAAVPGATGQQAGR